MADRIWEIVQGNELPGDLYRYRTISVEHLYELQDDLEVLDTAGKISNNATFRKYIGNKVHELPSTFPDAKSIIIIAVYVPLMKADFYYKGQPHEVLVPHYYDDGITEEHLKNTITKQIIGSDGYRIENAKDSVLYKRLAVRSGLGKYGRNNLCFVEGFGSFIRLHAFFTDYEFEDDSWTKAIALDSCNQCRRCQNNCRQPPVPDFI